ncbi:MAG: Stk1 family PASTA domain-containing Ser/Thr kinase [Eggerthellaceae bacterium]|nr:Stk1 family PASTA domain-containing Ser/Thr kinase [Eggerthellaceae bacterium]
MTGRGPMTGRVFSGRYEVGERIGIGGMAEVYSAQDSVLGRIVAIKVMLPQYAEDPDFARRFRQEAAAAANLQSPYIVNVYDWGHDDDTYFIVMEYIRGSDLKTAIQQRGPINQRKAAEIGAQVCQALTVAHKQDIIHRDIKPQNIMVQPDGNVKVMDFGIARAKNSTSDKTQTVLGTAHYASPEQAQGKDLTATSDVYSLGIVLYEAVTGTLPFDGPDAVSVALMQVQDIPPAPHEFNPDIDPDLEAIIMRAMEKDPSRRFATANDMRLALNNYLAGRPVAGANNGFTSAQTQVIAPIGAAAGTGMGETQVMPVTQAMNATRGSHAAPSQTYRGSNDDEAEAAKKKKRNIIIAVVAVLAIAIIGAVFAFGLGGERIEVPDVVNQPAEAAQQTLEDAGFQVKINNVTDDTAAPGTVLNQDPKAGSQAPKGSTVTLDVAQGTEEVDVPDVKNMTVDQARKALATAGFTVGDTAKEYSDDIEEGKIMSQDPTAGSKAKVGTKVNLVVSQGSNNEEVPDLKGLSIQAARSKAESAGFVLVEGSREYSDSVSADIVLSQSPTSGTKLQKGSSITVVVSDGKRPDERVTVPGVLGESETSARNKIGNLGLGVNVRYENTTDQSSDGKVLSQDPGAQQKVEKGSTITIVVGKYSGGSSTPSE